MNYDDQTDALVFGPSAANEKEARQTAGFINNLFSKRGHTEPVVVVEYDNYDDWIIKATTWKFPT
jgi:hypothetical protein